MGLIIRLPSTWYHSFEQKPNYSKRGEKNIAQKAKLTFGIYLKPFFQMNLFYNHKNFGKPLELKAKLDLLSFVVKSHLSKCCHLFIVDFFLFLEEGRKC